MQVFVEDDITIGSNYCPGGNPVFGQIRATVTEEPAANIYSSVGCIMKLYQSAASACECASTSLMTIVLGLGMIPLSSSPGEPLR